MNYKFVNILNAEEKITLQECFVNHRSSRVRHRAHWILLSSRKYTIDQISNLYEVDRDTISYWLSAWDKYGIAGLFDENRSGRPRKLTDDEVSQLLDSLRDEPRSIKRLVAIAEDKFGKTVSTETIKRFLRKLGQKWKRVKAVVGHKSNPELYDIAVKKLKELIDNQRLGNHDLYYFDASGFSLMPNIPYAWQPVKQTLEVNSNRSRRLNVVGFMDLNCNLNSYIIEGKVDSEVIISCFDDFVSQLDGKTAWVVLDNASIHTSTKFKAKISNWANNGLHLFYLPPYSPELNKIEILWRFIKYQWLSLSAYLGFDNLKKELDYVLSNIGYKYLITFV